LAGVRSPVSIVALPKDPLFPDDIREAGKVSLDANKVEHELELYSDVPHGRSSRCLVTLSATRLMVVGFAVYGDYEDSKIKSAQAKAFGQLLGWLQAH